MKKGVAILGAKGQIGFELGKTLTDSFSLQPIPVFSNMVDLSDSKQVAKLFERYDFRYVVNAAAYTNVDGAEDNVAECFLVNEFGPYFLAEQCQKREIPLIHISTDYVFNGEKPGAYTEDDTPDPQGMYAVSKLLGEEHIRRVHDKHIILRTSWVYSTRRKNFVKTMLNLGREHQELSIVSDQTGCPTPARYIAEAIKMVILEMELTSGRLDDHKYGTYHYCGLEKTDWLTFAATIFEAAGMDVNLKPISTKEYGAAAPRPLNSVLDCSKIREIFNIRQLSWKETLPETVAALMPNHV